MMNDILSLLSRGPMGGTPGMSSPMGGAMGGMPPMGGMSPSGAAGLPFPRPGMPPSMAGGGGLNSALLSALGGPGMGGIGMGRLPIPSRSSHTQSPIANIIRQHFANQPLMGGRQTSVSGGPPTNSYTGSGGPLSIPRRY